jgi:hypothetical protein
MRTESTRVRNCFLLVGVCALVSAALNILTLTGSSTGAWVSVIRYVSIVVFWAAYITFTFARKKESESAGKALT